MKFSMRKKPIHIPKSCATKSEKNASIFFAERQKINKEDRSLMSIPIRGDHDIFPRGTASTLKCNSIDFFSQNK